MAGRTVLVVGRRANGQGLVVVLAVTIRIFGTPLAAQRFQPIGIDRRGRDIAMRKRSTSGAQASCQQAGVDEVSGDFHCYASTSQIARSPMGEARSWHARCQSG